MLFHRYIFATHFLLHIVAPQFGNASVTLSSTSAHCVRLNWEHPQYPGGTITGYQVDVNNATTNVTLDLGHRVEVRLSLFVYP